MKEKMQKREKGKPSKDTSEKEGQKEGLFWNLYSISCIILAIILITFSCFVVNNYIENIKKHNVNYKWPKMSDLIPSIYILPLIMAFKTAIEYFSKGIVEFCLAKKYRQPKDERNKELAKIYRHKLARHIYKITFYVIFTIFGYYVLHDLPYFPKSMLGSGWMPTMFLKGFPESYFHEKPPLFDLYYNISLAYFCNDFIFLFIMERQSDFIIMLLHHICTISLIIFSFITNYSNIGSLVIFCHMQSDILVHLTRFLVRTDFSIYIIGFVATMFLINYSYMRQYVFGEMIYTICKYITWEWGPITSTLTLFLVILYILNIRWTSVIIIKIYQTFSSGKNIGDDINYDKLLKERKNK
jgi:hypothetical protein